MMMMMMMMMTMMMMMMMTIVILNPALFIVVATVGLTQGSHMWRQVGSFLVWQRRIRIRKLGSGNEDERVGSISVTIIRCDESIGGRV